MSVMLGKQGFYADLAFRFILVIYVAAIDPLTGWRVGNASFEISALKCHRPVCPSSKVNVTTPMRSKFAIWTASHREMIASQVLLFKVTLTGYLTIQFQFRAIPNPRSPMILHLPLARDVHKFGTWFTLVYNPLIISHNLELGFIDMDCSCRSTMSFKHPCLNKGYNGAWVKQEDGLPYLTFRRPFLKGTRYLIFVHSPLGATNLHEGDLVATMIQGANVSHFKIPPRPKSSRLVARPTRLWFVGILYLGGSSDHTFQALGKLSSTSKPLKSCDVNVTQWP
ncbi:uncharacterized protein LOC131884355 isoform X2 [Tigriopus californicus]|uniref:uncharacterized protein LOC131884355 isoform X2 n=1 Tax=Tigriopus californicus TaxID=6832 RepID=UPI0027DA03D4|nr:uncharacterized protein LOC131884355 isoform X2 [Tigriopus californicus]